jgi:hypothetical protein
MKTPNRAVTGPWFIAALAKCVAAGIASAKLDLATFLVEDAKAFEPAHPDPVESFSVPPSPMRSTVKPDGT